MTIRHRHGTYEVSIGTVKDLLAKYEHAFVLTDENVAKFWGKGLANALVLPAGEKTKSLACYEQVLSWLADQRADRASTLIALGGGVIGDLGGFVAATYMRGIRLVQVATTLLAMVDSSVGGKVGIDLPQGKNLVGAFYPACEVALCLETLATLPKREFNNGAAEVWKYGAILDADLLAALEKRPLGPGDDRLPEIVMRCVDLKRAVVEEDEMETSGRRAILNFGHTVGHALERVAGYGAVLHGEAISVGMVVEAAIGERLGISPAGSPGRLATGLRSQGLPASLPRVEPATLVEAMRLDKKGTRDKLAFALLTGYGSCKLVSDVPEPVVLECLQEYL